MFNITHLNPEGLLSFWVAWTQIEAFGSIVIAVLTVLIHTIFAVAIYRDVIRLDHRQRLMIVGPKIWCIATLVGGVMTVGIYWAMHHSRLTPAIATDSTEGMDE